MILFYININEAVAIQLLNKSSNSNVWHLHNQLVNNTHW